MTIYEDIILFFKQVYRKIKGRIKWFCFFFRMNKRIKRIEKRLTNVGKEAEKSAKAIDYLVYNLQLQEERLQRTLDDTDVEV